MYLADLLGGKPETDLEKAIDRFFLNQSISNVTSSFFDPNSRKRKLEEQLLEKSLTSDNELSKLKMASYLTAPAYLAISRALKGI